MGDLGRRSRVGPMAPELAITVFTYGTSDLIFSAICWRDSLEVMSPWRGMIELFIWMIG